MLITLTEPMNPRYIYINPINNKIHLLVPIVNGQQISTDNTCKITKALDEFFDGAVLSELNSYKTALELDLQLLDDSNPLKTSKQQRLAQINVYLKAVPTIQGNYTFAIKTLMQVQSNLYSIQLRPLRPDPDSRVMNPVFSIDRSNDSAGTPKSALYNALYVAYPSATIITPQTQLHRAVIAALLEQPVQFEMIQRVLTEQCQYLFGLSIDFMHSSDGMLVSQTSIDILMGFTHQNPATIEDYMDALLGSCALNMWGSIPTSPFNSVQDNPDKTEKLSILTQFFLGIINIHCAANGISRQNFGKILDASPTLSTEVAGIVVRALSVGHFVEGRLCQFFNEHTVELCLMRSLTPTDIDDIQQKFNVTYKTVTATLENPHMDDFMILDTTHAGKFVTHQGSICTNFSELLPQHTWSNWFISGFGFFRATDPFQMIRTNFEIRYPEGAIPPINTHIQASIDIDVESFITRIKHDDQFSQLPLNIRLECLKLPVVQLHVFLHHVAKGRQDEAEQLLIANPSVQKLLITPDTFTDYSGRTFTCSAYEYAYWAKDTYMCRMLEVHMDADTATEMYQRIDAIDEVGLRYEQKGVVIEHSHHFDFTPLKLALQNYIAGYSNWNDTNNFTEIKTAWLAIGMAQRDVPVYVANEYCRIDRSFRPLPAFTEEILPRNLKISKDTHTCEYSWFPLFVSDSSGLGVDFAFLRIYTRYCIEGHYREGQPAWRGQDIAIDLAAVSRLEEVRTAELTQSRENLRLIGALSTAFVCMV